MADGRESATSWLGHTLRPLPTGESWFSGGERRPHIAAQPVYRHDTLDYPTGDLWSFDELEDLRAAGPAVVAPPAKGSSANSANGRRAGVLLAVVSVAAIATIVIARRTGPPPEPAALPTPPSHVITAVSRGEATSANIRVGEYLDFQLPTGRTYSTVLEQSSTRVPVVEALTLPGQQPQLRADSAGHAVIEVMSSPVCNDPDGCAFQRTLVGTVELTVTR
jgi:hypothetical protein